MASFVEQIMQSGEKIEIRAKVSWLPPIALGAFIILLGAIVIIRVNIGGLTMAFLPLLILFLIIKLIALIVRCATTELAVTNLKIIGKIGFIRRHTIEILLPKVESLQIDQSIAGRLLNYGDIVVSGGGNPSVPIKGIDSPVEFQKQFMELKNRVDS